MATPDTISIPKGATAVVTLEFSAVRGKWEVMVARGGTEKVVGHGGIADPVPAHQAVFTWNDVPTGDGQAILQWFIGLYAPAATDVEYRVNVKFEAAGKKFHEPLEYKGTLEAGTYLSVDDYFIIS